MAQTLTAPESGYTYGTKQSVTIIDCAGCGIMFGITAAFENRRREDHKGFYCPNGHSNVYGHETPGEKAQRLLQHERARSGRLAAERDQALARERGQKAAKTRIKNERDRERQRIKNGVCPCCNRTFKQLARHMKSKHPNFPPPESAGE